MLQAANTDLFNSLVPLVLKAHNSKSQNIQFPWKIKQVKVNLNQFADL